MKGQPEETSRVASRPTNAEAESRYYRAMAAIEVDYTGLLDHLARIVAEVMDDFCVVHLVAEDDRHLEVAAFHHTDPGVGAPLEDSLEEACDADRGVLGTIMGDGRPVFEPEWDGEEELGGTCLGCLAGAEGPQVHSLLAVPLRTPQGHTLGTLTMGRHITEAAYEETDLALARSIASHAAMKAETARLTQDLCEANDRLEEAVNMRDMFISIASHELRTPLGAMQLLVELLRREAQMSGSQGVAVERVMERLEGIERQVGRMAKLVDRLLDVSRLSDGQITLEMEEIDLVEVIERVVERQQEEADDAAITVDLETDPPVMGRWDPDRIDQVVTNLVSNAVKYGGEAPIEIGVDETDGATEFWVRDHGVGIEEANQDRIFERFERVDGSEHDGGLGLGLWIVREIVEAFDGTIDVASEPGEGAMFRVKLPKN